MAGLLSALARTRISESKKKGQNGRRKFKLVLYKIQPDNCIDEKNEVGTEYNLNGITWIREYCEKALNEYLNDGREKLNIKGSDYLFLNNNVEK